MWHLVIIICTVVGAKVCGYSVDKSSYPSYESCETAMETSAYQHRHGQGGKFATMPHSVFCYRSHRSA